MFKEISIGFGLATIISLIVMGYDITPFIFLIAAGAGLFYLARARGMVSTKNFKSSSGTGRCEISFRDIGGQESAIQELREALILSNTTRILKNWASGPLKAFFFQDRRGQVRLLWQRLQQAIPTQLL